MIPTKDQAEAFGGWRYAIPRIGTPVSEKSLPSIVPSETATSYSFTLFFFIFCDFPLINLRYNRSTLALAQGVRRRNLRLDMMEGLSVKQRILIFSAKFSHPCRAWSSVSICSRVTPWSGSLLCAPVIVVSVRSEEYLEVLRNAHYRISET